MKLNQKGMSLIELLVSFAMASVASLGVYSAMNNMNKDKKRIELLAILAEKKNSFSRILDDPQTFKNTIAATENSNMQCLRDKVACDPTFIGNTYSSAQDRIVLYGPQQGLPFYDGRSTNNRGFTDRGAECSGFSYDLNNGNDSCPIGYLITWFAQNSGGSGIGTTVTITAKLVFNPSSESSMKSFINANAETPIRSYDAIVSRTIEAAPDLTTISCSQDGITLYHTANYTFYSTTSVPPGERCNQEIRQCIVTNDVPLLSGTFAHSTCAQNCYGEWSACSAPCGGGIQTYNYIVEANQWGATCAIANGSTQSCNTAACPGPPGPPTPPTPPTPPPPNIDCVGNWGACNAGAQVYSITTPASGSGVACPNSDGDTKACATPVDCAGDWSSCVGGIETYAVTTPASNGGAACSSADGATRTCSASAVDCVGSWGSCSKTCGSGVQIFTITTPAASGGAACTATNGQSRSCNTQACPPTCSAPFIEGGAGQASPTTPGCACPNAGQVYNGATSTCEIPTPINCVGNWGPCSGGVETYSVTTPAANGGTSCPVASGATRACSNPPVNCVGSWSACSGGIETYSITTPAANGGASCPVSNGTTRTCSSGPPVNCVGSWGPCSKTCGGGIQTYSITTPASNGGTACSASNGQTMSCNNQACPITCTAPFVQGGAGQASPTQPGCACPDAGDIYNSARKQCMRPICHVMTACTGNAHRGADRSCAYGASAPGMCPYPSHYHAGEIRSSGSGFRGISYWNCYPCGPGSTSTVCYNNPACLDSSGNYIDATFNTDDF